MLNEKITETIDGMAKTVDRVLEFIEDVEKMREIQQNLIALARSDLIDMHRAEIEAAEAKVDAFLAKRREG
jgi:hypothetical protein